MLMKEAGKEHLNMAVRFHPSNKVLLICGEVWHI